jgi:hypothetical protein
LMRWGGRLRSCSRRCLETTLEQICPVVTKIW